MFSGGPKVITVTDWIIDKLSGEEGTKTVGSCPRYMNAGKIYFHEDISKIIECTKNLPLPLVFELFIFLFYNITDIIQDSSEEIYIIS